MDAPKALTNVDDVRKSAPDLTKGMPDDTISIYIEDATMQVLADGFPKTVRSSDGIEVPIRELACRYLTLHLATMDTKAGAGIASEKVDVLERTYVNKTIKDWLNSSTWGQMYRRLFLRYASNGLASDRVILH